MRIFFDRRQLAHAPAQELNNGAFMPYAEHPGRVEAILAALDGTEAAVDHGEAPLRAVHSADYLEGRLTRAQAIDLAKRYQLISRARAEQSIAFTDQYRSYVINYGLGREMAKQHIERAGPDPAARWAAMRRILSEPTLPSDLAVQH